MRRLAQLVAGVDQRGGADAVGGQGERPRLVSQQKLKLHRSLPQFKAGPRNQR